MCALILMLCGVNVMSAYFNQFYVLIDASTQAGVLGVLARYAARKRLLTDSPAPSPQQ